jgi:hypothetical protein
MRAAHDPFDPKSTICNPIFSAFLSDLGGFLTFRSLGEGGGGKYF